MQYDLEKLRQREAECIKKVNHWKIEAEDFEWRASQELNPEQRVRLENGAKSCRENVAICQRELDVATTALQLALREEARRLARERDREPEPDL